MAENNQPWNPSVGPGQNPPFPPKPNLPTGEGESPLSKPSDIKFDLRTMNSDIASMKESGGGAPRPYVPPPPIRQREESGPAAPPPGIAFAPEKMAGPSTGLGVNVPFSPAQAKPAPLQPKPAVVKKSSGGLFYVLLTVVVVAGLAALGYFFIYPALFGDKTATEPEATLPPQSPEATTPPVVETPAAPLPAEGAPVPGTQISEHQSLLKTAADVSTNVALDALSPSSIKNQIGFSTAQVPILKEFVFKNSKGVILTAGDIMGTLLPDVLAGASSRPLFESDFTFLSYTNDKGTWLTAVLKLFGDASLAEVKTAVEKIESSVNLKNLFITDPGTPLNWKSGAASGAATRYLAFSQSGASLNYGWVGDILVISTSYDGFREVARRLR